MNEENKELTAEKFWFKNYPITSANIDMENGSYCDAIIEAMEEYASLQVQKHLNEMKKQAKKYDNIEGLALINEYLTNLKK